MLLQMLLQQHRLKDAAKSLGWGAIHWRALEQKSARLGQTRREWPTTNCWPAISGEIAKAL